MHEFTNRLINETSPYLLQHAHNPVDWYPWGSEAFEKARKEDKPVFLSIGYSSCHWCHVMEEESFENQEVAELMNENFICIKVDREERPDIDQLYMQYVQMTTGSGGWPMSVFLTPDQKPFFGGTYFPPDDRYGRPGFKRVLQALAVHYHTEKDKLKNSISQVDEAFNKIAQIKSNDAQLPDRNDFDSAIESLTGYYEPLYGGIGNAPKFPAVQVFNLFIRAYKNTAEPNLLNMVTHTLQNMADGGIYDQLGGGFARYSVDEKWLVPHFEKMLYDNGQLVQLYLDAYLVTGQNYFLQIAEETLEFIQREMTSDQGGFFSSLDADSEGEEGRFYVWTRDEIISILGESDAKLFNTFYGVTASGNFEGKTILFKAQSFEDVSQEFDLPADQVERILEQCRKKLHDYRSKRVRPGLDDKIITSWNALMLSAFARAYQITGNPSYREVIKKNVTFILDKLFTDGILQRTFKDGQSKYDAFIEDYAFLINALLDSYEAVFDPGYVKKAVELADYANKHFLDESRTTYFTTSNLQQQLVYRLKDAHDSSIPSGTGLMILNNLRLFSITENQSYFDIAENILKNHSQEMIANPYGYASYLNALDFYLDKPKEILIARDADQNAKDFMDCVFNNYLPNKVVIQITDGTDKSAFTASLIAGKEPVKGKITAYVCHDFKCSLPVFTPADLEALLKN
ncbi:MAG: thioredoxin domain-containing protein [Calditrichaeota bacterium]|nr:thioredoxin domain-containing protein [Calditrichota bacterium]